MGKAKKATKKFEKNRLKDTLERRKSVAKIKQRHQLREKKKARRTAAAGQSNPDDARPPSQDGRGGERGGEGGGGRGGRRGGKAAADYEDMAVDDFFQGAIDVPGEGEKAKGGKKSRAQKSAKDATGDPRANRKRKRDADDDDDDDDADADANRDEALASDDSSWTGSAVGGDEEEDATAAARAGEVSDGASAESADEGDDDEIGAHKKDLEALAQNDPEFYRYLKENDAELLDIRDDEVGGDDDDDDDGGVDVRTTAKLKAKKDGKPASSKGKRSGAADGADQQQLYDDGDDDDDDNDDNDDNEDEDGEEGDSETITMGTVTKWKKGLLETRSLRALKQVVLAFRAAAHVNDTDEKTYKYAISNADVYHEVLLLALKHVPDALQHHLPVKENQSGKVRLRTDSQKFKTLAPTLMSHATSANRLLTALSDEAGLKLALSSIMHLAPYYLSFKKVLRALIKSVATVWSEASNSEATRITAFLVLRRVVVIGDAGLRQATLRAVYQGLVRGSRNTTVHTIQGVNLMKNSAAELWGLDPSVGYTTGFTFIRQLAIHLRSCITNPTKDSYKTVYNWQFVHSLDFWSRVLATHCAVTAAAAAAEDERPAANNKKKNKDKNSNVTATASAAATDRRQPSAALQPLVYPTVQITLGAMRLIPTAQYFPLRFQLLRALLRLADATRTYIPLAPALLEVLASAEMRRRATPPKKQQQQQQQYGGGPALLKSLDFATSIRAPRAYLRTRVYQDGVGAQVVELLAEFLGQWATSIAFVELALPVTVMLKRWLKEVSSSSSSSSSTGSGGGGGGNRNGKVNAAVALLVQKLDANARWVEERRSRVVAAADMAPVHLLHSATAATTTTSATSATSATRRRAGPEKETASAAAAVVDDDGFLRGADWAASPLGAFVQGQRRQRAEHARMLERARAEEEEKRRRGEGEERDERRAAAAATEGAWSEDDDDDNDGEDLDDVDDAEEDGEEDGDADDDDAVL